MPEFDLFEIMRTTHSMWRLKTDPFPNTLLSRILSAVPTLRVAATCRRGASW